MKDVLFQYNPWWEGEFPFKKLIERTNALNVLTSQLNSNTISILSGLRRVGKTSLLKLLINRIIQTGKYKPGNILYVSMDNYKLEKHSILEIVEQFRKIHKHTTSTSIILFLDEVNYSQNWEQQLKNIHDMGGVKIFASSSSASILKARKPYLTGRSKIIEITPLTFEEFLKFKNIVIKERDYQISESYFEEFLQTGGMPEYVLYNDPDYINTLVDDLIFKDIAAHHNIRDIRSLKDYFLLLMERSGKAASINKMANIIGISPDTSRRYFQMFTDTFLIHPVSKKGKTNERILNPKKIYAADLGIRACFTGFRDKGALFENYIYLLIKHRNPCYIKQGAYEIDFLTEDDTLIEVKYNSDITGKQKALFDSYNATRKQVVKGFGDIGNVL